MHEVEKTPESHEHRAQTTMNVILAHEHASLSQIQRLCTVILCDRAGKRPWPRSSRQTYPKHPTGAQHRFENPRRIPLHMIEVQIGTYLGEDDIVRLEDNYGRA